MPKNQTTFSIKGQLDISDITKGLDQIKSKVQSADLGAGLTEGLMKDINAISKKFETAFKNLPGVGTTSKQVGTFADKIQEATQDLFDLENKLKDFGASEKYIKEFIAPVKKLSAELKKLTADTQKAVAAAEKFEFTAPDEKAQVKTKLSTLQSKMRTAAKKGERGNAETHYQEAKDYLVNRQAAAIEKKDTERAGAIAVAIQNLDSDWARLKPIIEEISTVLEKNIAVQQKYETALSESVENIDSNLKDLANDVGQVGKSANSLSRSAEETAQSTQKLEDAERSVENFSNKMKSLLSASTILHTLSRVVRGAIKDFQELDKQFNEIAIVSEYSTKEMWQSFAQVNRMAQEFGVTAQNVLEVQNLYYHQGKKMAEVNKLTAQTLTLAKITGMDYAEATSNLTAALNAYNIAAEDAVRVTDTIAAMDTNAAISSEELMTALTKTASIAANAGMSLESTEVFLTKMIETTREAPENLGTALKTIIARFGEVKQEIDGQEIELADINRVDTALKTIGISLLDTAGQIRDLDDVFMELSSKWDGLDRNTQRYIATIAAGSRQQSRFIAMMEDYDRTLELTEIAQNSAGLGASQLEKSMESLESSMNKVKSSWQEYYTGFLTSDMFKSTIDALNGLLRLLNQIPGQLRLIVPVIAAYAAKLLLVDKITAILEVTHRGVLQGLSAEQIKKQSLEAIDTKRKTTLGQMIVSYIRYSKALTKINKDQTQEIFQSAVLEKLRKGEKADLKEIIRQKLINEGLSEKEADDFMAYVFKQKAMKALNKELEKQNKLLIEEDKLNNLDTDELAGLLSEIKLYKELNEEIGKNNALKAAGEAGENTDAATDIGTAAIGTGATVGGTAVAGKAGGAASGGAASGGAASGGILAKLGSFITNPYVLAAIAAIAVIGVAAWAVHQEWEKNNEVIMDNTKSLEELREKQEQYNKSLSKMKTLESNLETIKKYNVLTVKTTEQLEEEQEAIKAIAEEYPHLVDYIDEEGNYHLQNISYLEKELELQKQITAEQGIAAGEYKKELAMKGIFSEDDSAISGISSRISGFVQEFDLTDKSVESQAGNISKKITGQYGYGTSQANEFILGFLNGTKTSITAADMNMMVDRADTFTQENYAKFLKAAENKNLANFEEFKAALIETGINVSDSEMSTMFSKFSKWESYIPEINQALSGARGKIVSALKESISSAFITADLGYNISNEVQSKIAEGFAKLNPDITTDEIVKAIESMDEAEYEEILNKYFNLDSLTNADINDKDFLVALNKMNIDDDLKKAITAYIEQEKEKINADYDKVTGLLGTGVQDIAENLTNQQVQAMAAQMARIAEVRNEVYAGWAYSNALEMARSRFGDDTEKMTEAINLLNKADLSSVEGVDNFTEEMLRMGYSSEEVYQNIVLLSGGIENVVSESSTEQIERLKADFEKLESAIESIYQLVEGSGSLSDVFDVASLMAEARMGTEEIDNFLNSINFTLGGAKMSAEDAEKFFAAYKKASKDLAQIKIWGYVEERDKYEEGSEEWWEQQVKIDQEKLKYRYESLLIEQKAYDTAIERLEKELEIAKEIYSIYKDWDRYQNINRLNEREQQKSDLASEEADFLRNSDAIAEAHERRLNSLNNQIAINQAGAMAASKAEQEYRQIIEDQIGDYVYFDENGTAIKKTEEIAKLYEKLEKQKYLAARGYATDVSVQAIEQEIQLTEDLVNEYNEAQNAFVDYQSAAQDALKAVDELTTELRQQVVDREELLIESIKDAEDAELDAIKEKYDAIKEEQDNYLDNVKKMIDKERDMRDRADRQQDIKDKEKKLAMMRMDTSGIYRSQIQDLERELEGDYQTLEDAEIDRQLEEMTETYKREQEEMDKLVSYTEQSLETRRKDNVYYYDYIKKYSSMTTDEIIADLKRMNTDYQSASLTEQSLLVKEWEEILTKGEGAAIALESGIEDKMIPALENAQKEANSFEDAIHDYGEEASLVHDGMSTSLNTLSGIYVTLASNIGSVNDKIDAMGTAYSIANGKAAAYLSTLRQINAEQGEELDTNPPPVKEGTYNYQLNQYGNPMGYNQTTYDDYGKKNTTTHYWVQDDSGKIIGTTTLSNLGENFSGDHVTAGSERLANEAEPILKPVLNSDNSIDWINMVGYVKPEDYNNPRKAKIVDGGNTWTTDVVPLWANSSFTTGYCWIPKYYLNNDKYGDTTYLDSEGITRESLENAVSIRFGAKDGRYAKKYKLSQGYLKYKTGGYVDYTGPAWVDGTKSHPEYMLNATQTQQFETLVAAMDAMYSHGAAPITNASQKIGDAVYNFHIKVDQMASDYDVDQLISRLEQKMVDASKYRNVSIFKNYNK